MSVDPIRAIVNKPRLFDPSAPLNNVGLSGAAARAVRVIGGPESVSTALAAQAPTTGSTISNGPIL